MGASGAAILVFEESQRVLKLTEKWETKFRGFEVLDMDFETKTFRCNGCPNRCEVVSVFMKNGKKDDNGKEKKELVARWGDRCGKWAVY